jgi:hypothetical protein
LPEDGPMERVNRLHPVGRISCSSRSRLRAIRWADHRGEVVVAIVSADLMTPRSWLRVEIGEVKASITRLMAGWWRFFTLIQCFDRPT